MITSPYNFVPLSDKVVSPFWAKYVSHDIPFKDAQSGVLDLVIKAESPVYVRNGVKNNASAVDKNAFNNINGQFFIPGSSVKGMLRSVMEIMSFGRMVNKVNNHKYSVRDFQNKQIYPMETFSKEIKCGFLKKINGEYYLKNCGFPGRISQVTLSKKMYETFQAKNKFDILINPKGWDANKAFSKSAQFKYDNFPAELKTVQFSFDFTDNGRDIYKAGSEKQGEIIFTGQPGFNDCKEVYDKKLGKNVNKCGKHYEFIFFNNNNEFKLLSTKEEESRSIINNFFFAYYDHEKTQQKDDWKYWKPKLDKGEAIPIFFRCNAQGEIIDLGLSFLYKITYENSITDLIKKQQEGSSDFDLAETIFGYTEGNEALKGRVHVSHAYADGDVQHSGLKNEVLAGPKASYYPTYITQNNNNGEDEKIKGDYQTFMNDDAEIRGWKRYPVHADNVKHNNIPVINGRVNEKIGTKFIPLNAGTQFKFQIHYHNLRKEELGALISAITFHNTKGLYHSLGSGKPLGYGKISIQIINLKEEDKIEYLKDFELFMDCSLNHSTSLWFHTNQIKELFAMAKPGNNDQTLKYMQLTGFVNAKKEKITLQKYSFISQNHIDVKSLASEAELKEAKARYDEEKNQFAKQQDVNSLKKAIVAKSEQEFKLAFEQKKHDLLIKLREKKEELRIKEETEQWIEEERLRLEKARSGIPAEWEQINTFKNAANRIPTWIKQQNEISVPEKFQEDLKNLLLKIIRNDKTLRNKFDKFIQQQKNKLVEWLGESQAQSLFDELKKLG